MPTPHHAEDALYALYLGTFVAMRTALGTANISLVQLLVSDALRRCGEEKLASVLAVTDARWRGRRGRHELLCAIAEAQRRPDWHA